MRRPGGLWAGDSVQLAARRGKPPVTIGTKNFTEQIVLGQLYAQALEAKGYTVRLKSDIGPTEVIDKELTSGRIDLYPEYTGVIDSVLAAIHTLTAPSAPSKVYAPPASAKQAYQQAYAFQKARGFTMLDATPFQSVDRVAVTPAFAKKHSLASMADLKKLPSFTYGAPPEKQNRYEGLRGMRQVYGLDSVKFVPLQIGKQYAALDSGEVDTIGVFSTDALLTKTDLVLLSDPKDIFGFQNLAPVVSTRKLDQEGADFASTLNAVSAQLTTTVMQRLNAEVEIGHQAPSSVAKAFLTTHGLA